MYSLTIEYQVFRFVSSFNILEQLESIVVTILQQIPSSPPQSDDQRCKEQILCRVVLSSCLISHNIAPHISLHDLPHHKNMKNTKILQVWELFCSPRGNSRFKHGSVIVHNIFAYFALTLSAAQVYMIQDRCWFSQIDFFVE